MIASHRDHLLAVWRDAHAEWAEIDTYVEGTFGLWPANLDRPQYHPPRARAIIDHAVDNQLSHEPIIHRFPAGKGEKHETLADKVEPFLTAVFAEAALLEPSLVFKMAGRHLLQYGYTVLEAPVLDLTSRPVAPDRPASGNKNDDEEDWRRLEVLYRNEKKTWMPFRTRCPHPSRVLMEPLNKRPVFAIKHAHRFSYELADMTTKRDSKRAAGMVKAWEVGENPFELVLTDEWWSTNWHVVMVASGSGSRGTQDDQLLIVERNTWGFLPFAHAFSGWGMEPTATGLETGGSGAISNSSLNPKWLAVGLLTRQIRETLKMEAQQKAGRHNASMEAMFNTLQTTMPAEELAAQRARGDIVEVPDQNAVKWSDIPQFPNWVMDAERRLDEDLEYGTFTRAMAGIRQQGVSTVGQQAILTTAAGQKFIAPSRQLEHLATIVGMNILKLVDVLGETMYCRGQTISPSDIEHDYSMQVTFELVDPVMQLEERRLGMAEVQAGLKSQATYWAADARLEDAAGERIRLLEDAVRADPLYHAMIAKVVAEQMGLMDIFNKSPGVPPPPKADGIPGGSPQAVGAEPQGPLPGTNLPPGTPDIYGPTAKTMVDAVAPRPPVVPKLTKPLTTKVSAPRRVKASAFKGGTGL